MRGSANTSGAHNLWYFEAFSVISLITKVVLITKLDESFAAILQLFVLKEELAGQLDPDTQLEQADARFNSRAELWAEQTAKIIPILGNKNFEIATVKNKNIFIQSLIQEFLGDSGNLIIDKKTSVELSNLAQKEDEVLNKYHCRTKGLLKGIHGRDQVIINGRNTIVLSLSEQ